MRDSNSTLARSKADSVSEKSARSKEVIIEAEVENQVPVDVPVNTPKSEILFWVEIFIFNEKQNPKSKNLIFDRNSESRIENLDF